MRELRAEFYADDVVVTGRTRASKTVRLKAETSGKLQLLHKEEGDQIIKSDVLAELELRDRAAKAQ